MTPKPPLKKRGSAPNSPQTDNKNLWRSLGIYGALGGQMVGVFLLCIWAGTALDKKLDSGTTFLLGGAVVGMVLSGYQVYRLIRFEKKNRKL